MSDRDDFDHDDAPDPVDKAYVEAEAMLSDDAQRAARRAQVLAAVAREPAEAPMMAAAAAVSTAPPSRSPVRWRPMWRRDGWLAAACVVGLGVLLASRFYQPITVPKPPAIHAVPNPMGPRPVTPTTRTPTTPRAAGDTRRSKRSISPPAPHVAQPPAPVPTRGLASAPPKAFPAGADSKSNGVSEVVVTGSRIQHPAYTSAAPTITGGARDTDRAEKPAVAAQPAPMYAAPPPPPPEAGFGVVDLTESLGAAAAAGRTSEVEALLAQGVPVDAADAKGDTALMKSVRADHPPVAALLLRHGASLDRKNKAGKSARDMAATADDDALNRALGIEP